MEFSNYLVFFISGLVLGMFLSTIKLKPKYQIKFPKLQEYWIVNTKTILLLFGLIIAITSVDKLNENNYNTIREITIGLFSASGLIFTFVVGNLITKNTETEKTIFNLEGSGYIIGNRVDLRIKKLKKIKKAL